MVCSLLVIDLLCTALVDDADLEAGIFGHCIGKYACCHQACRLYEGVRYAPQRSSAASHACADDEHIALAFSDLAVGSGDHS